MKLAAIAPISASPLECHAVIDIEEPKEGEIGEYEPRRRVRNVLSIAVQKTALRLNHRVVEELRVLDADLLG
ncbi:MAG: hypothetical protein QM784_40000 [Polyangiaceae bacterium]